MSIALVCQCGRSFKAKDEHAGLRTKCPSCGAALDIPKEPHASLPFPKSVFDTPMAGLAETQIVSTLEEMKTVLAAMTQLLQSRNIPPIPATGGGNRECKVLTQKDKWFSGKFDPEKLEQAVNAYAGQGWTVKGITTASIPGFGGNRDELVVLLER